MLVVQQSELRQYDESEESSRHARYADGGYPVTASQVTALPGQYRQTRTAPCGAGRGYRNGWQDATMPLMEQVYEASTLDTSLERERLTGALEEAANEFDDTANAASRAKTAAIFDLYRHPLSDARLRRELRRGRQRRCCEWGR